MERLTAVVETRREVLDFRPEITYFLGLADGLEILVGTEVVYAFGRVPVGTACMTGFYAITL